MIAGVSSLLLGHLAAGDVFLAAILSLFNRVPAGFLRFCALSGASFGALAALLGSGPARFAWLVLGGAALVWYAALRRESAVTRVATFLAAVFGIAAPVVFALLSTETGWGLAVAGSLSSALLLGAVTVTMILGHWYLVDTSLSIAPLRDGALWFWAAVLARLVAVVAVLVFGGWEVLRIHRAADVIFSTNGLFFLFRSLMGLIAPLLLAGLIWQTVKIRSTQSATGLLYVALTLVLFGELVSQFLRLATGYPL